MRSVRHIGCKRVCSMRCAYSVLAYSLLAGSVHAQGPAVYRCTGPNGQVVFQQGVCVDGKRVDTGPAPTTRSVAAEGNDAALKAAQSRAQKEVAEANRLHELRLALEEHRPAVGMTEENLFYAVGYPRKSNVTQHGSSVHKQHIYAGPKELYVYTLNGVVTSFQWSDSAPPIRCINQIISRNGSCRCTNPRGASCS